MILWRIREIFIGAGPLIIMEDRHKAIAARKFSNWKEQLNQFMTLIFIGNYHILNRGGDSIIIKRHSGGCESYEGILINGQYTHVV